MNANNNNSYKCEMDFKSFKTCMQKMLKSPLNWAIVILTYGVWLLVGMRYSTNQNFNMVTAQQGYIMHLSIASVIVGIVSSNTHLAKLTLLGVVTFFISFITVVVSQVRIICFGYPIGYYFFCPLTLCLFFLQIKEICGFACPKYYCWQSDCESSSVDINESKNNALNKQKKLIKKSNK